MTGTLALLKAEALMERRALTVLDSEGEGVEEGVDAAVAVPSPPPFPIPLPEDAVRDTEEVGLGLALAQVVRLPCALGVESPVCESSEVVEMEALPVIEGVVLALLHAVPLSEEVKVWHVVAVPSAVLRLGEALAVLLALGVSTSADGETQPVGEGDWEALAELDGLLDRV